MTLRVATACCLLVLLLAACGRPEPDASTTASAPRPQAPVIAPATVQPAAAPASGLGSGVYVWQRAWMPANVAALADSKGLFSELRVLAAQQHPREGWIVARVDLEALAADGRPVRPVIRLDGRLAALDAADIAQRTAAILKAWQAAGVHVDGVEIDFDCPAARLGDYATLLAAIRPSLPPGATLSITALPSWLDAPSLAGVIAASDEAVLQVHAVSDPKHGLFDARQALAWTTRFAQATTKPFRVALPAYGSALVVDAQGNTVGVESEAALSDPGQRVELYSDPHAVAALLRDLEHAPPPHLQGVVWFRLPLAGDRRAWPLATIRAVLAGEALHGAWTAEIGDGGNGAFDVTVRNSGNLETVLPAAVEVAGTACTDADALPGYHVEHAGKLQRFVRDTGASLPATQTRPLGWVRCEHLVPGDLHVRA